MEHPQPTTVAQPLAGMIDPQLELAGIADPWEQRVTAISLVAALRATVSPAPLREWRPDGPLYRTPREPLPSPEEFRAKYLPHGDLLSPREVDSWVRQQALRDGEPSYWLPGVYLHEDEIESYVPDGVKLKPGTEVLHVEPGVEYTRKFLYGHPEPPLKREYVEYITPMSPKERQAVRGGGVLDTLRLISLYLEQWDWIPAQGTTFVLTGLVPYSAAFAERVAVQHGRRPRPMSLKHLELAVFTQRNAREGLALRLAQWNELHPEWAYASADQFSSDSIRASRRMGP